MLYLKSSRSGVLIRSPVADLQFLLGGRLCALWVLLFTFVNKYNNLINSQYSKKSNHGFRKLRQTETGSQRPNVIMIGTYALAIMPRFCCRQTWNRYNLNLHVNSFNNFLQLPLLASATRCSLNPRTSSLCHYMKFIRNARQTAEDNIFWSRCRGDCSFFALIST